MNQAQFRATLPAAILITATSLLAVPAFAQAGGRWALSIGYGWANEYTYRTDYYSFGSISGSVPHQFGLSGLVIAAAEYRLGNFISLRSSAGYLGYEKGVWQEVGTSTAGIAGMWPDNSSLTAQMPFVSAGIRVCTARSASQWAGLYVEALPTLWVSRWRERYETGQYTDSFGNHHPGRVDQDAFTTLEPGFTAGAGFIGPVVGRTNLDVGFRYFFSAAPGQHNLGHVSSGEFGGLRQSAFVVALQRSL